MQSSMPDWPQEKISELRLKSIKRLTGRTPDASFYNALFDLLNSEPDAPSSEVTTSGHAWWKEAVFYQVYPRDFSSEGLRGIINKLDYIRELGAGAVILGPVCDSSGNSGACAIRDFSKILPELGTMRDMSALIAGLHKRGMKLVMDLAVNHTSDEHPWFQDALHNEKSPYRDFYFFRKGRGNMPPNNWTSLNGGPAWSYYPQQDIWVLHLFSKKQPDLNWESPMLRNEMHKIVRWWLSRGVDGFRLNAINCISKYAGLPDGDELMGELMKCTGAERYFYGPRHHEYLRELRREVFMPYNAFLAGEALGIGPMAGRLLTDAYREELDLIFSSGHLETPDMTEIDDYQYDFTYLKDFYRTHLNADSGHGWHALSYYNHDNLRMLSKIDPLGEYAEPLAKLLAVLQFTLRGTPFVYQGDEIGARNEDIENTRVIMGWDEVARQQEVKESVWRFYQKIIAWRKKIPACVYGALEFMETEDARIFCFCRIHEEGNIFVEVNLSPEIAISANPEGAMFVLGNYRNLVSDMQAYEARVYVY